MSCENSRPAELQRLPQESDVPRDPDRISLFLLLFLLFARADGDEFHAKTVPRQVQNQNDQKGFFLWKHARTHTNANARARTHTYVYAHTRKRTRIYTHIHTRIYTRSSKKAKTDGSAPSRVVHIRNIVTGVSETEVVQVTVVVLVVAVVVVVVEVAVVVVVVVRSSFASSRSFSLSTSSFETFIILSFACPSAK